MFNQIKSDLKKDGYILKYFTLSALKILLFCRDAGDWTKAKSTPLYKNNGVTYCRVLELIEDYI